MRQTAPGRYQADFELEGYGSFLLRAEHFKTDADGRRVSVGVSFGQVSQPYPGEYARLEPDRELLERAALASGGGFEPTLAGLFDPAGEVVTFEQPLWRRFILAAMGVFLLDLLMRRVRIFDREFKRGGRRVRRG
jgi:hypothetical protein